MWDFIRENEAKIRDNIKKVYWTNQHTGICEDEMYDILAELAQDFDWVVGEENEEDFEKFTRFVKNKADEYTRVEDFEIFNDFQKHFEIWGKHVDDISNIIAEFGDDKTYKIPEEFTGIPRAVEELSMARYLLAREFTKAIQSEKILKKILDPSYNFLDDEDYNMRYEY